MWTLNQAVDAVGGAMQGGDAAFTSVGTDSRADCSGQLFIALRGERFDGHAYVAAAQAAGAVAAMVDHALPLDIPQWVVADTRLALGRLAAAWRDRFAGKVVAITGSNGKTTAKEMVAAILARCGTVRATKGNLNNDIGMPLTLLSARGEDYLVLEMGANHAGEIGYMTEIARPDLALITNAGRAHLEGFGSVEGVAHAKGEIARGLDHEGVFVVDGDSRFLPVWRELAAGCRLVTFGLNDAANVNADPAQVSVDWGAEGFRSTFIVHRQGGDLPLSLRLAGQHNVRNALAAVAVATFLGVEDSAIQDGLAALTPVKGRLCPRPCGGRGVIDDTYNANPDSIAAAIEVLVGLGGLRWLVIGDLGELGADAERLHAEIGERARAAGVDRLASVGELSEATTSAFGEGAAHFADQPALVAHLRAELGPADSVLVKGSRLARMENVVEALCAGVEA
ncbi:UDP-N-acetylmuramoyl-tripeptide--D-alanyl-D-alanine ligase [Thiorhodococcus mannitoliphagus]|uniref:UDP-N-acetylmuramoyl-tripeptide--D-alanyl-D-alanine ligase n=1 Tax=Thiorhodococcus mannitoliphagus TaxID=329406 RepID=A0A6P1DLG2_9GAMM|nr:UDP-N-acetylmuramoyl-tripeptide--D-alanyl-D-alanine ligase [Thiorhodococcus mannitoliphagus]NEX18868.1 UDP-N-acetylmuramoyl-tripeptide--D-alanyl-D-alanine ligase [Thiorhodococcus mannitoliphagus]